MEYLFFIGLVLLILSMIICVFNMINSTDVNIKTVTIAFSPGIVGTILAVIALMNRTGSF
jgi:uncharacterized integral membrane protein